MSTPIDTSYAHADADADDVFEAEGLDPRAAATTDDTPPRATRQVEALEQLGAAGHTSRPA